MFSTVNLSFLTAYRPPSVTIPSTFRDHPVHLPCPSRFKNVDTVHPASTHRPSHRPSHRPPTVHPTVHQPSIPPSSVLTCQQLGRIGPIGREVLVSLVYCHYKYCLLPKGEKIVPRRPNEPLADHGASGTNFFDRQGLRAIHTQTFVN